MNKENCTKGPVTPCTGDAGEKINIECKGPHNDLLPIATLRGPDRKANAELIAETFNVLHHRGYTPLELVEHKGLLIAALKDLMESFVCRCDDSENPEWTPSYDRAEKLIRDIEQGNDLSKYQPPTAPEQAQD